MNKMKREKTWDLLVGECQVMFSRFGAVEQTCVWLRGQRADWLMGEDKYQFWLTCQNGKDEMNKYLKQQLRKQSIWCNKPEQLNFYFKDGNSWQYVHGVSLFKINTMKGKLELYKKLKHGETNVKITEGMFEYNGKNKGEVIKNRANITAVCVAASLWR